MAKWRKGWIAVVCGLASTGFPGGDRIAAGDVEAAGAGAPSAVEGKSPAQGLDGLDLARLARLEQQPANGGAEEPSSVLAGWDAKDGFYIKDRDNLYKLTIGGRVQIRYSYKGRDKRGGDEDADEIGGEDDSFLELERARLYLKGHVLAPELKYYFQIDGDTDDEGVVELLDYYVTYDIWTDDESHKSYFTIGAGQHKSYFLRQEATSSGKLQFPDRSLANEFFNIDRNLAVWLQGDVGPVFYAFEVANGFDSINRDPDTVDQIPALIAKLDYNIMGNFGYEESGIKCPVDPDFVIGGSLASDQNNGSSGVVGTEYEVYEFGLDTGFRWSIFNLQAEYMGRWLDIDEDGAGTDYAHGFYVQSGLFLLPEVVELAGRVSVVYGNEGASKGTGVEAGPGLNWYISKSHKVKLQTYVLYFDVPASLPVQTEGLDGNVLPVLPVEPGDSFSSSAANLQSGEQGFMLETQFQLEFG